MTSYSDEQRQRQSEFKLSWPEMPDGARVEGEYRRRSYPFVLPGRYASHNLWKPIRSRALSHFFDHNIAWHDGQNEGPLEERSPSAHLLDSQVCALNFWWGLGRSRRALTEALRVTFDDVQTAVAPDPRGPLVEAEWVGLNDYLGEHGWPSRGKYATSADILLAYEDHAGRRHGVLVESKYTESYSPGAWLNRGRAGAMRGATYGPLLDRDDSPLRNDLEIGLGDLLIEPFYQHLRQQLLAVAMERERELGFETVTCLHVSPRENRAFHTSITAPKVKAHGDTVSESWRGIMREPDRYRSVVYEDVFAGVARTGDPVLADWTEYQRTRYGWDR